MFWRDFSSIIPSVQFSMIEEVSLPDCTHFSTRWAALNSGVSPIKQVAVATSSLFFKQFAIFSGCPPITPATQSAASPSPGCFKQSLTLRMFFNPGDSPSRQRSGCEAAVESLRQVIASFAGGDIVLPRQARALSLPEAPAVQSLILATSCSKLALEVHVAILSGVGLPPPKQPISAV
jgi:hypothetical protein